MTEKQTPLKETDDVEEIEEEENERDASVPTPQPQPQIQHHPIVTAVTNLNTLQNQAYLLNTGQASATASHSSSLLEVRSGDELLVTLTLNLPVKHGELPYVVDIVYEAKQKEATLPSGIFLYKQTTIATFTPGLPNNGNLVQSFPLQTIRFDLQHRNDGPADIAIHLHHKGQHVGKHGTGKFRIHPGG